MFLNATLYACKAEVALFPAGSTGLIKRPLNQTGSALHCKSRQMIAQTQPARNDKRQARFRVLVSTALREGRRERASPARPPFPRVPISSS